MPRVVDHDQRRRALTEAASRVIARAGIEAATMREVAAEAGWTTGVITHYFADKQDLLLATYQTSLAAREARRIDADADPEVQLRAALRGALPTDDDHRQHWLVTLACCTQASGDRALADAQRRAYHGFRDRVGELAVAAGYSDADGSIEMAETLIAATDGIAIQALFDPDSWPAERQRARLDATIETIRAAALAVGSATR